MCLEAKLWALQQYPEFAEEKLASEFADLDQRLDNQTGPLRRAITLEWLRRLIEVHGNEFSIKQIPPQNRRHIDIVEETRLIVPPGRIIEV